MASICLGLNVLRVDGPLLNSYPHGHNGRHFPDDIFECIFMNEKFGILIQLSLKFVPKVWAIIWNVPRI